MDVYKIKELAQFKSRQFAGWGLLIHEPGGYWPAWIVLSNCHILLSQRGIQTATERGEEILRPIKVEEPVGPVCPRYGPGGTPI